MDILPGSGAPDNAGAPASSDHFDEPDGPAAELREAVGRLGNLPDGVLTAADLLARGIDPRVVRRWLHPHGSGRRPYWLVGDLRRLVGGAA
jgi:hypothetical protein